MSTAAEHRDRVLRAIDERELVDFARRMAEIPSQCSIDPEEGVAAHIEARMKEAGLATELRQVQPHRPNVLGFLRGSGGGPSLMFNGHTDTQPISIDWPYGHESSIENGVMRCPGIRNRTSGVAAMVMAAVAIARAGVRLRGDLIVAGVMGHHDGSVGTRQLISEGLVPDLAIVPEPTDLGVRTIQSGTVNLRIHVRGRSGPTGSPAVYRKYSNLDNYPVDAIQRAVKVMQALETVQWTCAPYPPMPDLPMYHVAGITGGYGPYCKPLFAPDYCTLVLRVLAVPGQTAESVKADVERTLAAMRRIDPDLQTEVEVAGKMRLPLQIDNNSYVAQAMRRAHVAVTGQEPVLGAVLPNSYFGCDAQPLAEAGCQAISYGPAGHAYYAANRGIVRIDRMVTCARALALAALDICGAGREEVR
ncbi:MAG: M20/M25/M40 family metallo-hydrolase [Armatimonadetes bacterium]|nr:M20/M25/M40 family metallo-hydrolase [Armatimonadota bacterium]